MFAANPESPAIVFLDNVRNFVSARKMRGQLKFQPCGKILAKTTRIDEMRFDLAMFEGICLNNNGVINQRTPPTQKESDWLAAPVAFNVTGFGGALPCPFENAGHAPGFGGSDGRYICGAEQNIANAGIEEPVVAGR